MFSKLTKGWFTGLLLFLPFQLRIADSVEPWSKPVSAFIQYLDEITIVVFLLLAIIEFYRRRMVFERLYLILSLPIIALSISGLISGMINGNPFLITSLGIFDYIKNFLVIFIFAIFFKEADSFKTIFHPLLVLAVFLGIVAFVQELWALLSVYAFGNDIHYAENYFLRNLPPEIIEANAKDFWRLGIYRAPSFFHHPNGLGLYNLLILTIYLFTVKKVNPFIFLSLFTGVFVSVSRMIYLSFIFLAGSQILKARRWLIIPTIPIMVLTFLMSFMPDFSITDWLKKEEVKKEEVKKEEVKKEEVKKEDWVFRVYARGKAMEVWKDHPLLGAGPGMFGGVVSIVFHSPLYEKYNFSQKWFEFMKPFRSLDQFWPQALAEIGVVGTLAFAGLILAVILILYNLAQKWKGGEIGDLSTGLAISTVFLFIYSLGSGLNQTAFLFTYSAIVGMVLGYENYSDK
ncbi:MAG: O-antigen ligase family protein [Thermodesulfovibrionales bacterium]